MPQKRVRMLDVANAAGVSSTTVSYVLNGQDMGIPQPTRQRVLAIAERMGYRANRMAQQLARQDSGIIGLMVPDIESPFFAALTTRLNWLTIELEYRLMFEIVQAGSILQDEAVLHAREQEGVLRAIDQLLDWNTSGLLFWLHRPIDVEEVRRRVRGVPTVCMGVDTAFGRGEGGSLCDYVYLNNYAGTLPAIDHLLHLGHRRFCFVAPLKSLVDDRRQALEDRLAEAGLEPPLLLESEVIETPERIARIVSERSENAPTAFICVDDHQALSTFSGLRRAGLRIPEDASLVSCDGGLIARSMVPRLTCVALPVSAVAESAIQLLRDRMVSDSPDDPRRVEVTPHLEIGESTAPPPKTA